MRSIWKGSSSFGLVNIPVAVYPATKEEKVSFKQFRKKYLIPIRYKKVAEADEEENPASDLVKGYEYEKGKWIVNALLHRALVETGKIGITEVSPASFADLHQ